LNAAVLGLELRQLVLPKSIKSIRRKRSVSGGRLQISMAQIMRKRPGVLPIIGELIAGRMSQHMRVNLEWKLSRLAGSLDHSQEPRRRNWSAALRHEHIRTVAL
jgi:hypothetical protein